MTRKERNELLREVATVAQLSALNNECNAICEMNDFGDEEYNVAHETLEWHLAFQILRDKVRACLEAMRDGCRYPIDLGNPIQRQILEEQYADEDGFGYCVINDKGREYVS